MMVNTVKKGNGDEAYYQPLKKEIYKKRDGEPHNLPPLHARLAVAVANLAKSEGGMGRRMNSRGYPFQAIVYAIPQEEALAFTQESMLDLQTRLGTELIQVRLYSLLDVAKSPSSLLSSATCSNLLLSPALLFFSFLHKLV